jgi:HAD superfamily hydrolase (TIGR01549 family)
MGELSMQNEADIKGIIFDLDGTLYRMRWFLRPILTLDLFPNSLRLPRFLKIRGAFSGLEMDSGDNLMNAICDKLAAKEKCSTTEMKQWIQDKFYPSFVSAMRYFTNSRPAINETLKNIKKCGFKLAVLSDYDKVYERLILLNIDPSLFDTLTSSESSGALKPSARPFLEIAQAWNLPADKILVIGDRDDTDGEAARCAQMQFMQITDSKTTTSKSMDWNKMRTFLNSLKY